MKILAYFTHLIYLYETEILIFVFRVSLLKSYSCVACFIIIKQCPVLGMLNCLFVTKIIRKNQQKSSKK
jgi:hypothetical protein